MAIPVTLDQIVTVTRMRLAERQRAADLRLVEQQAAAHSPRGFRQSLEQRSKSGPAIIAELKKASPSKGVLRASLHVGAIARNFMKPGAAALSVLTEEEFFLGSLSDLREASASCDLPCLCKDFIVDEFQLLEARANGADAVLLLASVLADADLQRLHRRARELQLDVLCEAHDESELERALAIGCELIGVNNRDLRTFQVDLRTALRLVGKIPKEILKVAESGIESGGDIRHLRAAGYQAFLIGESFMKADDPGEALRRMLTEAATAGK